MNYDEKQRKLINGFINVSDNESFFETLKSFFKDHFEDLFFEVIKLSLFPPFYLPEFDSPGAKLLINEFSKCSKIDKKNSFYIVNDYYVFQLSDINKTTKYLLAFDRQLITYFEEIQLLCQLINNMYKIISKIFDSGFRESSLQNANLISQMCHDTNSLISLLKSNKQGMDITVTNKIKYTEKMASDILQYVREVQVLTSEVKAVELLNSIIQNIFIPESIRIEKEFFIKDESVVVDVELINKAIGEIINNSIIALKGKPGKIKINAAIRDFQNIFIKNRFLEIKIEDSGNGINEDFVNFVKNPFFTTWKSEYHSGLGLSIADKIINAHGGYLKIENSKENKTLVTIYLPNEKET